MEQIDLKEVRDHIQQLRGMKLDLMRVQPMDGSWDWWLDKEIAELEKEIANEHKGGISPWMIGAS